MLDPAEVFQCQAIGNGCTRYCQRGGCIIVAGAILPTHTQLVILRMRYSIEQISNLLRGAASAELSARGLHPFADQPDANGKLPTPWALDASV